MSGADDNEPLKTMVRRLFGSGAIAFLAKAGGAALSYIIFVLFARLLSADTYGHFAFAFNLGNAMSTIAGLGAATAILRFWPQYTVQGMPALARGAAFQGGWLTLAATVGTALLMMAAAPLLARATGSPGVAHLIITALAVPLIALSEYVASLLRAMGYTFLSLMPRDIGWRILIIIGAGAASLAGLQLSAALALGITTATLLLVVVPQLAYAVKRVNAAAPAPAQTDMASWRKAALPLWGAAILYVLVQQFDVVIAGLYLTPAETGAYFAAQKTASLLTLLLIAGNLVAGPLIATYYHAGDIARLQRMTTIIAVAVAAPTLLGLIFLALAGKLLLGLFDPAFIAFYPVLLVLGAGYTFDAITGPTGYVLQMSGHERSYLRILAITYLATLVAQLILAPRYGALGIAIPNALGVVIYNLLIIHETRRKIAIDPSVFSLFRLPSRP